jgi:predicted DNA-binding antitoxin AbrB/MazE fold protein
MWKARVRNGRLTLDEPTTLPEGAEVHVTVDSDELDAEERAELHRAIEEGVTDAMEGRDEDAYEAIRRLRARA